jgi:hypothetical protein
MKAKYAFEMREEPDHGDAWAIGSRYKVLTILPQITIVRIISYNDDILKS